MNNTIKTLLILSLFAVSSFSQETTTAQVPVVTNVAAKVSIQPNSIQNGTGTERNLVAGVEETLEIQLNTTTVSQDPNDPNPILPQGQIRTAVVVRYERGRVFIELNPSFKNADISLFSLNGKQILHGKASGSESLNISQSNISEGIYLLLVKGAGGNSQSARIMHRGGTLNINATFSGSVNSQSVSAALAKAGDYGTWTITATADGYETVSYDFEPDAGTNPKQTITLNPNIPQPFNDITAAQLVANIKIGWNLSNTFDATDYGEGWMNKNGSVSLLETLWGVPVTTKTNIDIIKAAGFNAIRIPVTWSKVAGSAPNYTIRSDWMARITEVVNYAAANDMYIIVNTHHDELHIGSSYTAGLFGFTNSTKNLAAYQKIWEQIANNFKNHNEKLIFEGLNEPRTVGTAYEWSGGNAEERGIINEYYQTFVNTVRASGGNNDKRILMINTHAASGSAAAIDGLVIPTDIASNKIIVSIHLYTPYDFSYNRGSAGTWSAVNIADTSPITDPIDRAYAKFVSQGIPVIIGEFGVSRNNNIADRIAWTEFYLNYALSKGLRNFLWDCAVEDIFWFFNRSTNQFLYPTLLTAIMETIESANPPSVDTYNLGDYAYGYGDGTTPDKTQAVWDLSPANTIIAQTTGTKLVLELTNAPVASMQLVWQNTATELWWQVQEILGTDGSPLNTSISWNVVTKKLTINLDPNTIINYNSGEETFISQSSLQFIIAYYGGSGVDDLGIVSANLEVD